jgi:hypothetical protein
MLQTFGETACPAACPAGNFLFLENECIDPIACLQFVANSSLSSFNQAVP